MKKEKIKIIKIIISIIILVLFDQITKYLVVTKIRHGSVSIIKNFLDFLYVENTGAAFGLLRGQTIFLIIITLVFMYYIFSELKKSKNDNLLLIGLVLIISGSIGNLIDRLLFGYVIDFISFTIFNIAMPIFNVADIFITFGVCIYLFKIIKEDKK